MKRALITGITGQDGAYLSELLLAKGYDVHGIKDGLPYNTNRVDHYTRIATKKTPGSIFTMGILPIPSTSPKSCRRFSQTGVYNLGAMSHVKVSFEEPEYVAIRMARVLFDCWRQFACWVCLENTILSSRYVQNCTAWFRKCPKRKTPFPQITLWRCEALCVLDNGKLS